MLNNPKIDIVYIASPIGVHYKFALLALKAGKNVWCEKPLTCNYENTISLVHYAQENNLILEESFMFLHHPQFKGLEAFIKNSNYGRVHSVICKFGIPNLENPGFRDNPMLCGGAFWDVGSYTVSAAMALFPDKAATILFAEIKNINDSNVDRTGRVLLRFENDISVYLEWSIGVAYRNEIDIWAEKGSIYTDKIFSKPENYHPTYKIRDLKGNEHIEDIQEADQFIEMFEGFCLNIASSKPHDKEFQKILERSKLLDKIFTFAN